MNQDDFERTTFVELTSKLIKDARERLCAELDNLSEDIEKFLKDGEIGDWKISKELRKTFGAMDYDTYLIVWLSRRPITALTSQYLMNFKRTRLFKEQKENNE